MGILARDEAVSILEEGHARLSDLVEALTEDQLVAPRTIGGGDWSAKDLIGHIATWEEAATLAIADIRRGQVPAIEEHLRDQTAGVDRYNEQTIAAKRELPFLEIRQRAEAAHRTLVSQIGAMRDEEWTAKVPYETDRRKTLAELVASITGAPKRPFAHAFAHIPDLESYVSSLSV